MTDPILPHMVAQGHDINSKIVKLRIKKTKQKRKGGFHRQTESNKVWKFQGTVEAQALPAKSLTKGDDNTPLLPPLRRRPIQVTLIF